MNEQTIEQIYIQELKFTFTKALEENDTDLACATALVVKSLLSEEEYMDWCCENDA